MPDPHSSLDRIASRVSTLYSRPSVALEVIKLTEQPQVDPREIKKCLERDPALACRVLRVVNSSSFGLRMQVGDLNQAIALLGIKPLKLVLLGFSLPNELFSDVSANVLQWYWTNTLTRAVAARMLSEQLWRQPGEEAFTAALVQDVGVLALLRELGPPYAKFLAGAVRENCNLSALENETLGFDHVRLSALLLARWRLPPTLVEAVATPKHIPLLAQLVSPAADTPQILCLAEMLTEVVAQRRLQVLPRLLEAGEAFQALTAAKLNDLVDQLQPQVDRLAGALSLELNSNRNYAQVLRDAHEQLAELAVEAATSRPARHHESQLLAEAHALSDAMQTFLHGNPPAASRAKSRPTGASPHDATPSRSHATTLVRTTTDYCSSALLHQLNLAADRCRRRRQELSLLLVEPNIFDPSCERSRDQTSHLLRQALREAASTLDNGVIELVSAGDFRTAAILSNCERRAAVSIAHHAIASLKAADESRSSLGDSLASYAFGVATVAGVPRNFAADQLFESAERCLAASRTCGISTVKSIEV